MHGQLFRGTEYVENMRRVCGREVIGIWTRLRREQRRQSERRMETSCLENRTDPYIVSKLSVAQKHKQHSFRSPPPTAPIGASSTGLSSIMDVSASPNHLSTTPSTTHPNRQDSLSVISATWHFFLSPHPQLYVFSIPSLLDFRRVCWAYTFRNIWGKYGFLV